MRFQEAVWNWNGWVEAGQMHEWQTGQGSSLDWNSSVTDWADAWVIDSFAFKKYWRKNYEFSYSYNLLESLHEKTKKTLRNVTKKNKKMLYAGKKTIFSDSSGVTPWKTQKTLEKTKKKKAIFSDSLGGGALEIVSKYCFFGFFGFLKVFLVFHGVTPEESENIVFFFLVFLVFSRFFWFFHGVTPEESENIGFFLFFFFFWFSQGFFGFFMEWPQKSLKIFFFCFFCFFFVFSRFFCFFRGVTPEESENIVFFFCFPDVFLILGRRSIVFLWGLPQSALRYCIVMTIYEEDKNGILKIRILCCK